MVAGTLDITIEQGATFILPIQWMQPDAITPYDLTGFTVRMQMRKSQGSPVLFDATTANGKIIIIAAQGKITVTMTAAETSALDTKAAKYDLEAISSGGIVYRVIQGSVTISPNITQVWTVRLKTQDELDIDTATSNRSQLQSKAEQALSINVTYLSLTTPTTAQNTAQIKALTRQVSAVIRLLLQKLDNLAGT